MPERNQAALEFLSTRRSRPAKTLNAPAPNAKELGPILTMAARSPDHGKLEPWRFIVLEQGAMGRLADQVVQRGAALNIDEDQTKKARAAFASSPLAVVVVSSPIESPKVPEIEQIYSAGAVCLALLNAALASGWGANWLSGWISHDRQFLSEALGLSAHENVAGIIHIGTESSAPPERPRPDVDAKTIWVNV